MDEKQTTKKNVFKEKKTLRNKRYSISYLRSWILELILNLVGLEWNFTF
ncbi:hypothetical protein [Flavobacterium sp. T12S277]